MSYAQGTCVGEDRSRAELQFILERFGADQFGYQNDKTTRTAAIAFRFKGVHFVFRLPLSRPDDKRIRFSPSGRLRINSQVELLMREENRRRWRSLCLAVKAMLVGVEDGIFEFGQVFMPYMVWGDGRTTWQALLPTVEECLKAGRGLPAMTNTGRMLEAKP